MRFMAETAVIVREEEIGGAPEALLSKEALTLYAVNKHGEYFMFRVVA
jgi:hypothetical protein